MNEAETQMTVSQNILSIMDVVGFSASLVSLLLGFYAIGLARSSKRDADASKSDAEKFNKVTHEMLVEIKAEAMGMSKWGRDEITASSNVMRNFVERATPGQDTVSNVVPHSKIDDKTITDIKM